MSRLIVIARDPLIAAEAAAELVPQGVPSEHCFGSSLSPEEIFAQLSTVDMFEPHKAFIYNDFLDIKLLKATSEKVESALARMPAELTLICTQVFDSLAKGDEDKAIKGADFQRFAAGAKQVDRRELSEERQALRWLTERAAKNYGLTLSGAQAQRLWTLAAERNALADSELRKLALSRPSDAPPGGWAIPEELFKASVSETPSAHFYTLVDAIMLQQRGAQELLTTWHSLEPGGTFRLVFELRRKLLGLLAMSRGEQLQPPWLANQLRGLTRHWPIPRLHRAVLALAKLEHDLKSGLYPGESSKDAELSALQVYVADVSA